ncbi:MAG: hypothetical protein N4A71_06190 [Carboxylicivirga sp.]|jgi:hypothetical protein|nr:hypothetical protein [Carboxylicivirga sp.]
MKTTIQLLIFMCFAITQTPNAQTSNEQTKQNEFLTIAPRFGVGIHNYTNLEVGISSIYINNRGLAFGAASAYTVFIFQQSDWNSSFNTYGVKAGLQSSWSIFMWGLEWKTLFANEENDNYLSPKIGLSLMDIFNVEYAYNVLNTNNDIQINSKHQIGININLNKKLYTYIFKE